MILKRTIDFIFALIGLCVLWPFFIVIALLIKFKMPNGPIIFKQKRVGQNGKLFTMYKFRTMITNHGGSSISVQGEDRITGLGLKLRKYKIDELPELWNVLIGNMSFVGPRPDVPGYADKLEGENREILKLKPGITGPASLMYRNEEEILKQQENPIEFNDKILFPDKIRINLLYLKRQSTGLDFRLIIQTIFGGFDENKWK